MSQAPIERDYAAVLRAERPLIDVRSPGEFARGAAPGAVNLPLLNDEERAAVGVAYKRRGREAAVALGERLVYGTVREGRVAAWRDYAARYPQAAIYCWRGGQRSAIAQRWLAERGVTLQRLAGGFKALRRCCLEAIERSAALSFIVVGGRTGAGKTAVVRRCANHLDLEALANHRGSAFGAQATPQPSPVGFENALATALMKLDPREPVVVEDEGRTIGRLAVPATLFAAMRQAPVVLVEARTAERVDGIYREYVASADQPRQRLLAALDRIERRLGGERHREIAALMRAAFDAGDAAAPHRPWIERLLACYYDPMYDYQIGRKQDRVVYRGGPADVVAYLRNERPPGG